LDAYNRQLRIVAATRPGVVPKGVLDKLQANLAAAGAAVLKALVNLAFFDPEKPNVGPLQKLLLAIVAELKAAANVGAARNVIDNNAAANIRAPGAVAAGQIVKDNGDYNTAMRDENDALYNLLDAAFNLYNSLSANAQDADEYSSSGGDF
jgi:hypothetical protein